MRTASSAHSTAPRRSDVAHLQKRLVFRLLLVSLVPLAVIAVLGVYAYRLSGRVAGVEVVQRMSWIDRTYGKTRNVRWALAEYKELADRNPDNVQILLRQAAISHRAGESDSAVALLKHVIEVAPDSWEAYSTLAFVELERANFAAAINAGETALAKNPLDAQGYNNLAWIYATEAQFLDLPKAKAYVEKALRYTNCTQPDYRHTLIAVYTKLDVPHEEAAEALCKSMTVAAAAADGR